jgi:LacI family transcriptional regulator
VPQDVSVVAFDEGLFAEIGTPKLTTFTVDYIKMAEMGAESIVLKLEDKSFHLGKKVINGHVISRESVSKKQKQKWSTIPLY